MAMKKRFVALFLLFSCFQGWSQHANAYSFEAGKKGIIALGGYLIEADIPERQRLTYQLLPKRSEYAAVFQKDKIRQIQKYHRKWYRKVSPTIGPLQASQRFIICQETTPEELLVERGSGKNFPGGYGEIADWFLPGVNLYRIQFVDKGARVGTSYDVFVYLEDHWRIFPKPWKAKKK